MNDIEEMERIIGQKIKQNEEAISNKMYNIKQEIQYFKKITKSYWKKRRSFR